MARWFVWLAAAEHKNKAEIMDEDSTFNIKIYYVKVFFTIIGQGRKKPSNHRITGSIAFSFFMTV